MKYIIITIAFSILSVLFHSCASSTNSKNNRNHYTKQEEKIKANSVEGKLIDMTNTDGCGWVIKLKSGIKIQPVNIDKFDIELADGQEVWVQFHKLDLIGTCMAGDIVELESIIEKKYE